MVLVIPATIMLIAIIRSNINKYFPEHYLSTDANIALDERGNYQANYGEYATSQTGIFTAGDCRRGITKNCTYFFKISAIIIKPIPVRIGAIMVLVIPTTIMLIALPKPVFLPQVIAVVVSH
jgi:hypothetical protein